MLSDKIKKHLNKLEQKRYRKEFSEFVVEGVKGVFEAVNSDYDIALILIEASRRDDKDIREIVKKAERKEIYIEFANKTDLEKISSTETFPGILAIVSQKEFFLDDFFQSQTLIFLDAVNDPGNLGTIIRTADWFGIKKIILGEKSVDIYNPKVVRSTMGSIFHVDIIRIENSKNILERLKKEKFIINSLELKGENIEKIKLNKKQKNVFLFGSESHGLNTELEKFIDKSYTISGLGQAESLNLAVSAGIIMYKITN